MSRFWYQRLVGRGLFPVLKRDGGDDAEGRFIVWTGLEPPEMVKEVGNSAE